ncbi:SlyX family protein [Magnetospira thiophila]
MNELSDRIDALEAHAAEQERLVHELSDVLADHWRTIEALKREVLILRDRLQSAEHHLESAATDDKPPPHY